MSTKRIALLMIAPAALAHILAIPTVVDIGSVLDASVSQALLLVGVCGYSLAGGTLAYLYARENSRSPLPWALAVIVLPFAAPFVLGCLGERKLILPPPELLPRWNFEPVPVSQDLISTAVYANPEWDLSLPLSGAWRITTENTLDPTGRLTIVGLEGDRSLSGKPVISMNAIGCAHTFSPEEIAAYTNRQPAESRSVEALLKAYHDTYKDEFMNTGYYMGQEILAEGASTLAGMPSVMFLGSVLSPTGKIFEKQISVFGPGGACRYVCSMPEEQRPEVEAYFDRLVQHCAPFVSTNVWTSKLLALEPASAPLTTEALDAKKMTLPLVTPAMMTPDDIPLPPFASEPQAWNWQQGLVDEEPEQKVVFAAETVATSLAGQDIDRQIVVAHDPVGEREQSAPQQAAVAPVVRRFVRRSATRTSKVSAVAASATAPQVAAASASTTEQTPSIQHPSTAATVVRTAADRVAPHTGSSAMQPAPAPSVLPEWPAEPMTSKAADNPVEGDTAAYGVAVRVPGTEREQPAAQQTVDPAMLRVAAELVAPRVPELSTVLQEQAASIVPERPGASAAPKAASSPVEARAVSHGVVMSVPEAEREQRVSQQGVDPAMLRVAAELVAPRVPESSARLRMATPLASPETKPDAASRASEPVTTRPDPAAKASPASRSGGPIVSWKMEQAAANAPEKIPPAAARAASEPQAPKAALQAVPQAVPKATAEPQLACSHCGKTVLSKEQFIRVLSAKYGIEVTADSTGRLKVRSAPSGKDANGAAVDAKKVISELQRYRALKCTNCESVLCLNCLAAHAPSHKNGGKACINCQSPSLAAL